jgi:hypothetical protein
MFAAAPERLAERWRMPSIAEPAKRAGRSDPSCPPQAGLLVSSAIPAIVTPAEMS